MKQIRYWGIWIPEQKAWMKGTDEKVIYYPAKSIAAAHVDLIPEEFRLDYGLEVRPFLDEHEWVSTP